MTDSGRVRYMIAVDERSKGFEGSKPVMLRRTCLRCAMRSCDYLWQAVVVLVGV